MPKRKSRGRLSRAIVLFGLTLALVCLPVLVYKAPRIIYRGSEAVKSIEKTLRYDLNPGTIVSVGDKAVTQPLTELRQAQAGSPLRVNPNNPRYFTDEKGKAILLTGSHTWTNFQDSGLSDPPPVFDYDRYLDFLVSNNHNFFRLYVQESAKWITETTEEYWYTPLPYQRVGKEMALDGKPKFDLTKFNQAYFDRLRQRVIEAKNRGIYVSIMLFNGWNIEDKKLQESPPLMTVGNPWRGHPYNRDNNINGINGDPNKNGKGEEIHTLQSSKVTSLQETYVRKVIDTVNDLDNVLYEISNESDNRATAWQYYLIDYTKNYEAAQPKQHPVGMTVEWPGGDNSELFKSPADWISLNGNADKPPVADGRKVIIADTDHLCGICGDRQWAWKSFTRGENPIFMDYYDGSFILSTFLLSDPPTDPLNHTPWVNLRRNLGYILTYANRINLAAMKPRGDLASTDYCLANPVEKGAEYLVYIPSGSPAIVDLSATHGELLVEWFNPSNGLTTTGIKTIGGGNRSFALPFQGDAVLYIHQES